VITIVGAGSIGLSLGGRLARSGAEVCFVTRREAAAGALRQAGVTVRDPASGASFTTPVRAVSNAADLPEDAHSGPFLLCVRATDTEHVGRVLARALPSPWIVSAQNDVDNEAALTALGLRASGLVVRQTCTRQGDTEVFALGAGRVVLGDHPGGFGPDCEALAARFEGAGFDVGRSDAIGHDKWLKLCVNLMSTPNALVRRGDHASFAFVEVKARLLEEAAAVLDAHRVPASSCDGKDRSLEDEIDWQRASRSTGDSARDLPIYNAVWRALQDPALGLEADRFHARIVRMGADAGIETPTNERALEALEEAVRTRAGPESISAEDLLT